MAVDTSYVDFEDMDGLAAAARASRADGFTGMLAIHPDQVETINQAFTPTKDEIQEAREIIAAFDASPSLGSLQFNGRVIDKPHLRSARRMVSGAGEETVQGTSQRTPILRSA